jgi:hypothetical protein
MVQAERLRSKGLVETASEEVKGIGAHCAWVVVSASLYALDLSRLESARFLFSFSFEGFHSRSKLLEY